MGLASLGLGCLKVGMEKEINKMGLGCINHKNKIIRYVRDNLTKKSKVVDSVETEVKISTSNDSTDQVCQSYKIDRSNVRLHTILPLDIFRNYGDDRRCCTGIK